ncbi:MAG: hypothetical protein ACR2HP_15975 [Ilumatobacteraceae bacterium]
MRAALVVAAAAAGAWLGRRRLVGALTRTTGTWIGTPPPPSTRPTAP